MFANKKIQFWGMLIVMFIIICLSAYFLINNQMKRNMRMGYVEEQFDPLI